MAFGVVARLRNGMPLSRRDFTLASLAVVGVVSLAIVISRLPEQSLARLLLLGEVFAPGGRAGTSIATRVDLYGLAIEMFVGSPLIGHGTGAFAAIATTRVGLEVFTYPHNDLLQVAAEFGLVGAVAFIMLAALSLFRRIPRIPAWSAVRIILVFMLVIAMTSGDIYGDRLMWGLMLLVLCAPLGPLAPATSPAVPDGGPTAKGPPRLLHRRGAAGSAL